MDVKILPKTCVNRKVAPGRAFVMTLKSYTNISCYISHGNSYFYLSYRSNAPLVSGMSLPDILNKLFFLQNEKNYQQIQSCNELCQNYK